MKPRTKRTEKTAMDIVVPFGKPDITEREIEAAAEVLRGGWLTAGAKVEEFEEKFARFIGVPYAVAVSSGTAASLLAMDALYCGSRDVFVTTPYTFTGPAMMAYSLGMRIRMVDVSPKSFMMDPQALAAELPQHRGCKVVVMPTHFGGSAVKLAEIIEVCSMHSNVFVIDDAAHALPTTELSSGRMIGSLDTAATVFSFYGTKTLTTGEGGMVTTHSAELAKSLRTKRMHGFNRSTYDRHTNLKNGWKYDVVSAGWKATMTDVAAAIGLVQLDRLIEMRDRRRQIAEAYHNNLGSDGMVMPDMTEGNAWCLYPAIVQNRDSFIRKMGEAGVQCSVHYLPLHYHTFWANQLQKRPGDYRVAEAMYAHEVSLPIRSGMSDADVQLVIDTAKSISESD